MGKYTVHNDVVLVEMYGSHLSSILYFKLVPHLAKCDHLIVQLIQGCYVKSHQPAEGTPCQSSYTHILVLVGICCMLCQHVINPQGEDASMRCS